MLAGHLLLDISSLNDQSVIERQFLKAAPLRIVSLILIEEDDGLELDGHVKAYDIQFVMFDAIIISSEIGYEKPDAKIFEASLGLRRKEELLLYLLKLLSSSISHMHLEGSRRSAIWKSIVTQKYQMDERNHIFRALAYIHGTLGVCHRDIKPQNVLVVGGGSVDGVEDDGPKDEGPAEEDEAGGASKIGGGGIEVEDAGEEDKVELEVQWMRKVEMVELESEEEDDAITTNGARAPRSGHGNEQGKFLEDRGKEWNRSPQEILAGTEKSFEITQRGV
ncbi:hypothetical protein Taro_010894 [Colocasia esculenta]|uniref:Protein kinase domain-containing protein n=1 Tax=Colocasia esculenta TaxID=4460 RepID=A0A843U4K9_COLES|nr:hypothetical protein [Colocasia esculenta]